MTTILHTTALTKRFGGLLVTDGVSLALAPGARHALIGPNGAGKTTLVGLLSGALKPDEGSIILAGRDVTLETRQARVKMGLVRTFQVNNLFAGLSALDNVLIALNEHRRTSSKLHVLKKMRSDLVDEARRVLSRVGLPDGDTPVARLPYGLQRLVELAIAFSLEPKVLLLDEPCAGVPADSARRLLDVLADLPSSVAVLMIEHDMRLVRQFATEATVLVGGAVLLSGRPDDILENPEVHRVYLGREASRSISGSVGGA